MGLIDRWNKFALRKLKINDTVEICMGRLIFGTIIFLIAEFTTFPLSWVFILFGVKVKRNRKSVSGPEDGS